MVEAVLAELPEATQHVDSFIDATVPPVLGDAGLVQRIIANIVINARTYAPNSRIELHAQQVAAGADDLAGADDQAGAEAGAVELAIVDHGPGFPSENLADVFTPFQRLGDQSANQNGLGLGLAVAHGFAEAMNGTLEARNTPGGGATLVLSLPTATGELEEGEERGVQKKVQGEAP